MKNLMEYKDYHAKIEYSSEDDIFFGFIIGIADSITFEGKSVSEPIQDYSVTKKRNQ